MKLETEFENWAAIQTSDWRPRTIGTCSAKFLSEEFCFSGRIEVYFDCKVKLSSCAEQNTDYQSICCGGLEYLSQDTPVDARRGLQMQEVARHLPCHG